MAKIKDIAAAAGVSIGTVDRILHNRGRFSDETAGRVRRAVKELNYTPNMYARGLKKSGSYLFGAVIPNDQQDAGYWGMITSGIERASAELSSFCEAVPIIHFDRYSEESCREALQQAVELKFDGLLTAPVLPEVFLEKLQGIKIPYLFVDTDMPESTERVSFIGQDSLRSGILAGRLMSLLIERKEADAPVVIVEPPGLDFHLQSRIDGFFQYMRENRPEIEIERLKIEHDDEKQFHRVLGEFIDDRKLPSGFFSANSSVYYLASFLSEAGPEYSRLPVIGYDLIPGREDLIKNGIIDFILTQQPEEQSYQGIMKLYDALVLNKTISTEIIIPLNIITKENLHTFG